MKSPLTNVLLVKQHSGHIIAADSVHFRKTIDSLTAEDIATAVAYAIETPDRISVSEIMIRPTKQGI